MQNKRARILLVDDHALVLSSVTAMLAGTGHCVVTANSGLEAVRQLNASQFDLVLLDLMLPDISGQDVMDYMRTHHIDTSVVVISATCDIDAAIGALQHGAFDFLRKPFLHQELLKTVANALHQRWLEQDHLRITGELNTAEKIHRYLIDSSPDIIYSLDAQGCFTYINDRVHPLLGWTVQEVIGQHYALLIHPHDLERAQYVFHQGGENFQVTRNVELHMRPRHTNNDTRLFSHELMRMALPVSESILPGMPEPWGTYGIAHDLTERKRTEALITYQAYHDVLTELPNRALFKDRLALAVLHAQRHQSELAVLVLDIDRFKWVNDTLGHDAGDALLVQIANRLKNSLRSCDTLARLGGDEFTVILPELSASIDALHIADKCLLGLRQPFTLAGKVLHLSASIGIALHPQHGCTPDELLKNADVAMYHQKSNGKDGCALFAEAMINLTAQHMTLDHELHQALAHGELVMYYQPQVDAKTQKIIGVEALMRWNHPQRGLLGAGEFLPFAEENGLIIAMTDWMLEVVCKDLQAFNDTTHTMLRMSINLSPNYLDRGNFGDKLKSVLFRYALTPAQFEVEVTENICIRNPLAAIEQLSALRDLGVRIAIDDFGTGYSSLSYLHRLPIHTLKIDRSFVMAIHDDTAPSPVVMAIISVAKGLNLHLVAEGVETETQRRYLSHAGCHTIQGYYHFKPMPKQSLMALLVA